MLCDMADNKKASWKVVDAMRGSEGTMRDEYAYAVEYLAYFIKTSEGTFDSLLDAAKAAAAGDELIFQFLESVVSEIDEGQFYAMTEKASVEELRAGLIAGPIAAGRTSNECSTPEGLISLVSAILDVHKGERVVDFGSGFGAFLESIARCVDSAEFVGVEINPERAAIARMRARISGSNITYEHGDMFEFFEGDVASDKADKAFANYPWGVRAKHLKGKSEYLDKVLNYMAEYGRPVSADWARNRLLVDSVKQDGIAIGIMTNGSASNEADARVRKHFIENGWIPAAISLPAGLFAPSTNIATTLLVLGHGGSKGVMLVDATDLGTKERRGTLLSEADVREIIARLSGDSDKSILVSVSELADRDYTLSANRFLQKEIDLVNPVAMEGLVFSVTRGASIRARGLDELACIEDTGIHYLNLANISDGLIDDELPSLKELDPKLEKYCLETGDLVLSKNGAPYKVAVAEVPEGRKILASGNLYVIKLDTEKVDPYYVAAFLNSSIGKELLARESKGSFIPNLSLSALRAMKIPVESEEKQSHVAMAYRAKLDEITVLKLKLSRARQKLMGLFEEEA